MNVSEGFSLRALPPDSRLLFGTRIIRLFAYGLLSVALVLYLVQVGLSTAQVGMLLTLTLLGDTLVSLWMTTAADRLGRRRMLLGGAGLMLLAGGLFAGTHNIVLLTAAAIVGVLSPSGNEVGPFLSIEQAALSHIVPDRQRTHVFAWYNLVGSFATALGALVGGTLTQVAQAAGGTPLESYRLVVIAYAALGLLLMGLFARLSPAIEVTGETMLRVLLRFPRLGP